LVAASATVGGGFTPPKEYSTQKSRLIEKIKSNAGITLVERI
jgi:hypothetical protein